MLSTVISCRYADMIIIGRISESEGEFDDLVRRVEKRSDHLQSRTGKDAVGVRSSSNRINV